MLLKAKNRTFSVFQTLGSYQDLCVYLARDTKGGETSYLVNEISSPQVIRSSLKAMLSLRKESNISEFEDIFTLNSRLYVVFKYAKPYLLLDYLNKYRLSFAERVKLMENYLFQLSSYSHLPPAVLQSLTDPDNINIQRDRDVYFNFSFKPAYLLAAGDKANLFKRLGSLLKILFAGELSGSGKRELLVVMGKCEKNLYKSIPEMNRDVKGIDTSSNWDKVREYFHARKNTLNLLKNMGLTFLTIVIFIIIYTRFISPGPGAATEPAMPVTQIGEVTLETEEDDPEEHNSADQPEPVSQPRIIRIDDDAGKVPAN